MLRHSNGFVSKYGFDKEEYIKEKLKKEEEVEKPRKLEIEKKIKDDSLR